MYSPKINELMLKLETVTEELKMAFYETWDKDSDIQETFELLKQSEFLSYYAKGLNKYVELEIEFTSSPAEEFFIDYVHDKNAWVQINSGALPSRIYKRIKNYLALINTDGTFDCVLSLNGKEETIETQLEFDNEEEKLNYIRELLDSRQLSTLVVEVDNWGTVSKLDAVHQTEYAS